MGSGADLGEEQNRGKEGGTSQPLAYHKCVLYCNIEHWLLLCFLLKQVIKGLLKGDSIPIFYIYPQRTCGAQITVTNLPPPPPPSSPRSNKKKSRAGVNTGGVVNLFGNGFSGPAILFLIFLAGLRGEGKGWDGMFTSLLGAGGRRAGAMPGELRGAAAAQPLGEPLEGLCGGREGWAAGVGCN